MDFRPLGNAGVLTFEPKVFGDARGFFTEFWHEARYREAGIAENEAYLRSLARLAESR